MKVRSLISASLIVVSVALASNGASAVAGSRTRGSAAGCDGVRPGAHVTTSKETGGTLNFLFRARDGVRYIATAGHLLADESAHVWRDDTGPTAAIDDGTVIGRAVFARDFDDEDVDFALIRLFEDVRSNPSVCHWGGPTGLNDDVSDQPQWLHMYGNGVGTSAISPERTLLAPRMTDRAQTAGIGVATPGDSGAPVIGEDGRAVGIQYLVGVVWGGQPGTDAFAPGTVAILRLGPQVAIAERALGIDLELLKAPLSAP